MHSSPWYHAIGIMSGTSLDGMDIALCAFREHGTVWDYELVEATTVKYTDEWIRRLSSADTLNGRALWKVHVDYGHYIGEMVKMFIGDRSNEVICISSHGHTVFHRPDEGYTLQIGDGAAIAAATGLTVVWDFRSGDVALGGQGAPLVPIGDELLFGNYAACINLGGFGNISYRKEDSRIAFDICPVNKTLNLLATEYGLDYDPEGSIARKGNLIMPLLDELNALPFYNQKGPRSLGQEWFVKQFLPILQSHTYSLEDRLYTLVEHIAFQAANALEGAGTGQVLVTGGGAHNTFLIERMQALCKHPLIIPSNDLVDYKEALVFALMGLLRMKGQINCLSSATGARRDSCAGSISSG